MTTIAWDGKYLAGDRQTMAGDTPLPRTKVYRLDNPILLVGCAGIAADCQAFVRWISGGVCDRPTFEELSALVVYSNGRIEHHSETENVYDMGVLPYWAIGSGADYALGAMAHGASAEEAVRIATALDIHTGLGVDKVTF